MSNGLSSDLGTARSIQQTTRWMERARGWLDELDTPIGLRASSATGHFYALFGRDSLWSVQLALEAARLLPHDHALNEWSIRLTSHTLRALAATQGKMHCDTNEEQPGKIVHEYWPETPPHLIAADWPLCDGRYYGSADATFLYLMTAAAAWQLHPEGRDLVASLWDSVRAALDWALQDGNTADKGYILSQPRQPEGRGLRHHVWKDSSDSAITESGAILEAPVAWLELQGYALAAFLSIREILQERGEDSSLQAELERRAAQMSKRVESFWLPAENCPAMVLTSENRPLPLVSSNIGHILWCGALMGNHAHAAADRILHRDLLTSWGLRTLSSDSYAFAPLSYHRGSIWPFDNAIAAGGLWRMSRCDEALLIGSRVMAALEQFDCPMELYCALPSGWVRAPNLDDQEALVEYHDACSVQAWSAAAILLFNAQLLASQKL